MNKKLRLEKILDMLRIDGTITTKEIIDELDISDMTARRDLDALEADGLLTRTHGGAQLLSSKKTLEKTHIENKNLNTKEKIDIAKKACSLIKDGDTIFIGPGTTLEQLALELKGRKGYKIRVITNSLPVFLILNDSETIDLLLLGGEYREITGSFVGSMASTNLKAMRFALTKALANLIAFKFVEAIEPTKDPVISLYSPPRSNKSMVSLSFRIKNTGRLFVMTRIL